MCVLAIFLVPLIFIFVFLGIMCCIGLTCLFLFILIPVVFVGVAYVAKDLKSRESSTASLGAKVNVKPIKVARVIESLKSEILGSSASKIKDSSTDEAGGSEWLIQFLLSVFIPILVFYMIYLTYVAYQSRRTRRLSSQIDAYGEAVSGEALSGEAMLLEPERMEGSETTESAGSTEMMNTSESDWLTVAEETSSSAGSVELSVDSSDSTDAPQPLSEDSNKDQPQPLLEDSNKDQPQPLLLTSETPPGSSSSSSSGQPSPWEWVSEEEEVPQFTSNFD